MGRDIREGGGGAFGERHRPDLSGKPWQRNVMCLSHVCRRFFYWLGTGRCTPGQVLLLNTHKLCARQAFFVCLLS